MRKRQILFTGALFILLGLTASGQNANLISGNFTNAKFSSLIEAVELQTSYRFYYDSIQVDSLLITASFDRVPVSDVLNTVFKSTDFRFSFYDSTDIFITRKIYVSTKLLSNYFIKTGDDDISDIAVADNAISTKDDIQVTDDNKLFEIGDKTTKAPADKVSISGYIKDEKNGEAISGAVVYLDNLKTGVTTDQFGYYTFTLPTGRHVMTISAGGMKSATRQVQVYEAGNFNIDLADDVPQLKTVVITAERHSNLLSAQMGVNRLNIKSIKQVPSVLGEADVLKVVLTLPGVTSAGEGSTGFNVRGGSSDQNLILLNDATIYNPSHLFGFFSAFNPDVIKSVELYKSAIPAKYGGRLSSVLDVATKDGNSKKITGSGGIGLLTSKLSIEGPLSKEKTTFVIGGRTTYSDWLLKQIKNAEYNNSRAAFYDANLHISHIIDKRNTIYLTGYISHDRFNLNNDTAYRYGNKNIVVKWKHIFNNKLYQVTTAGLDHYDYNITSTFNPVNAYKLAFGVKQAHFRSDINYALNNRHNLAFGLSNIYYKIQPGSYLANHPQSLVKNDVLQKEQALETALYISDQFTVSPNLTLNAGLRYTFYNYLGPHEAYRYATGLPRQEETITDTVDHPGGKFIRTYHAPELRLSGRYSLSNATSVKISFNTLRQYIHMLSSTTAISPTDTWKLSNAYIKPQTGYQVSAGYYHNFKSNTIETSVEVYYKQINHFLDYKSGAQLILNHHIETDVINTRGKAYGAELLLKKTSGKLNGWLSYAYSRTFIKQDDALAGETINKGRYYPASFDKPHNVNFIGNFRFSHRYSISMNMIYSTGRPVTLPIAVFNSGGAQRLYYSDRNQYRIPDYIRTDFSVNIEGNHKTKQAIHNSWSIGVYNMLARQNAYSVYFVQQNGVIKGYQLSVFGTAIPFITFNFRF